VVRGDLFIRKKTPLNSIKQVLSDKNKRHYFENYLKQLNINRILLKDLIVVVLVENLYLLKSLHKVDREYQLFIEPLYFLVNHK
jgi:acetone carboxylase gamma subunit